MAILTRDQVCEKYQLSRGTLDYWIRGNKIPYSRLGKKVVRFDAEELDQWFKSRKYHPANYERKGGDQK